MFKANEVFSGTYQIQKEIGHGGTGVVYLAYHQRLRKYVVVKRIRSDFDGSLTARTEVDILKNLHHPYLPQVYDFFQVGREVYTVMDYIQGQGLDVLLETPQRFPEKTLCHWLRQMLEVLDYLHNQKRAIIHSDIKPGNIILTPQGDLCLIDFNISLDGSSAGKISGFSPFYAAPEQLRLAQAKLNGQASDITLDARTDLYSLAATFYTMVSGRVPLADRPSPPLRKLLAGQYSEDFLAILDKAMAWEPRNRYRDAKKMIAAVDRLKRQDSRYRGYLCLQAVSWLGSALLLGAGLFCVVRGVSARQNEDYTRLYKKMAQQVQLGNDAGIEECGSELLSSGVYQKILTQAPKDHSAILYALGDCRYNQQEYGAAADYYRRAWQTAPTDDPQRGRYCSDCAIALTRCGDLTGARAVLAEAEQSGIENTHLLLIRASIDQREGNTAGCLSNVQALLAGGAEQDQRARACLIAAEACAEDAAQQAAWLEAAAGYSQARDVLRRLGANYMTLASTARPNQAGQYAAKALQCYQTLCASIYPAVEDRLNLAIVQRVCGDAHASIGTLNQLERETQGDYRVSMNRAFAYEELGDFANAAADCSLALRLWRQTPETDREASETENLQALHEMEKRLGQ